MKKRLDRTENISKIIDACIPEKIGSGMHYVVLLFLTALMCITAVYWVSQFFFVTVHAPMLVASMGAAAVLMFASPASPMASSWAFLVGNSLSAIVGVTAFLCFGNTPFGAGVAVATAILIMHFTHSMHPPGGATALFAVVGGSLVEQLGYYYLLFPVLLNVSVFFIVVRLHRFYLKNRQKNLQYASKLHEAIIPHVDKFKQQAHGEFIRTDIEQAIKMVGGNPDVSLDYLYQLFENTLTHAQVRKLDHMGFKPLKINPPIVYFGDDLKKIIASKASFEEHTPVVSSFANSKITGGRPALMDDERSVEEESEES